MTVFEWRLPKDHLKKGRKAKEQNSEQLKEAIATWNIAITAKLETDEELAANVIVLLDAGCSSSVSDLSVTSDIPAIGDLFKYAWHLNQVKRRSKHDFFFLRTCGIRIWWILWEAINNYYRLISRSKIEKCNKSNWTFRRLKKAFWWYNHWWNTPTNKKKKLVRKG